MKGDISYKMIISEVHLDMHPPRVMHCPLETRLRLEGKIDEAIDCVTTNVKLSKNNSDLLRYYASCENGFPAALALVLKRTGIPDEKGWRRSRRKLEQLSLITYRNNGKGDHFIIVNWTVICGIAMLEKPLDVGGRKHDNFVSPFKRALQNIMDQVKLTDEEYFVTANILSLLPLCDLRKIANAVIPIHSDYQFKQQEDVFLWKNGQN